MRAVVLVCVLFCSMVFVYGQDTNDVKNLPKYDNRYDFLDIDEIMDNKRLVRNYVDCLLNVKPCTPEGKTLKRLLPEALRTKCVRCTERQKKSAVKIIRRLKTDYPEEWAKLSSRWDPTGDFTRYFEDFLAKESFNTISGSGNEISSSTTTTSSPLIPMSDVSKPPVPVILNRFGNEDKDNVGSSSSSPHPHPRPTHRPPLKPLTWKPTVFKPKPTQSTYSTFPDVMPTIFPAARPNELNPPLSTAITIIDQIGNKIIKTTELVTDILKNTVKAVVG